MPAPLGFASKSSLDPREHGRNGLPLLPPAGFFGAGAFHVANLSREPGEPVFSMPSVRILGLPRDLSRKFTRACEITGSRKANWLAAQIRTFVMQVEAKHGDLFEIFSPDEQLVLRLVADGAAEKEHVAEEGHMTIAAAGDLLERLVKRGALVTLPKGGKTEQARGAKIKLYFLAPGISPE